VLRGLSFASRSNRFWQVLHLSGFTPRRLEPTEQRALLDYGCGVTAAVRRPTRRGAEISPGEFRAARPELEARIRFYQPRAIAFLGKRAIAAMLSDPAISWGQQPAPFAGAQAWVLPNPSGLNRTFGLDALVAAYSDMRLVLAANPKSV